MKGAFETGPLSKAEELETLLGWLGLEYSLPMQPQFKQEGLGIAGMLLFDWAHCLVCEGVVDVEMALCFKHLHSQRSATSYAELGAFVAEWRQPAARHRLDKYFTEESIKTILLKKNPAFPIDASEIEVC